VASDRKALVTGITGQDGAYLAQLLLSRGYEVYGAKRPSTHTDTSLLESLGILDGVHLVDFELLEYSNIQQLLDAVQPDEIYNLAAQSFPGAPLDQSLHTADVTGMGVARLLKAMHTSCPDSRLFQASTAEMFGHCDTTPQTEIARFQPRTAYGTAKLFAHWMTVDYRETAGLHASSGILFNHESPLRGEHFVTRKVTQQLAQIAAGQREVLELGNLSSSRDWGYAPDYVEAMWLMLQQDQPDDYVLATGVSHSVREFVSLAASVCGFELEWTGSGQDEQGTDRASGRLLVRVNPQFYREEGGAQLCGDASKARKTLAWAPKTSFEELVVIMAEADLKAVGN
jgi:GDPmannose 4,6-dehydratase